MIKTWSMHWEALEEAGELFGGFVFVNNRWRRQSRKDETWNPFQIRTGIIWLIWLIWDSAELSEALFAKTGCKLPICSFRCLFYQDQIIDYFRVDRSRRCQKITYRLVRWCRDQMERYKYDDINDDLRSTPTSSRLSI